MRTSLWLGQRQDLGIRGASVWLVSMVWLTGCGSDPDPQSPPSNGGQQVGSAGQRNAGGTAGTTGTGQAGSPSGGATGGALGPTGGANQAGTAGMNAAGGLLSNGSAANGGSGGAGTGGTTPGSAGAAGSTGTAGAAGTAGAKGTACTTDEETKFSFFMTSHAGLQRLSGKADGFGGDLGGLSGADSICQQLAESSSACQSTKVWRAFLSTTTEDAIDRIGDGPWHDRLGRLLANNKGDLLPTANTEKGGRPANAAGEIKNDFPNEDGVPNRYPDGGSMEVDNHQTITGSGSDGRLYTQSGMMGGATSATGCQDAGGWTREAATCWDWTSSEPKGCPRVGHSWGAFSGWDWISVWNESGCAPGGTLLQLGGTDTSRKIGSGGGYGGFYCFAVTP